LKEQPTDQDRRNEFQFYHIDPKLYSYNDIFPDNIFDFTEYVDQGNENEIGVPQNPPIGIATFYG
jgi:hypothetical protein